MKPKKFNKVIYAVIAGICLCIVGLVLLCVFISKHNQSDGSSVEGLFYTVDDGSRYFDDNYDGEDVSGESNNTVEDTETETIDVNIVDYPELTDEDVTSLIDDFKNKDELNVSITHTISRNSVNDEDDYEFDTLSQNYYSYNAQTKTVSNVYDRDITKNIAFDTGSNCYEFLMNCLSYYDIQVDFYDYGDMDRSIYEANNIRSYKLDNDSVVLQKLRDEILKDYPNAVDVSSSAYYTIQSYMDKDYIPYIFFYYGMYDSDTRSYIYDTVTCTLSY